MSRLYSAHSRRSPFLSSWATRAMRFGSGEVGLVMPSGCLVNVAGLPRGRYLLVYIACLLATRRERGGYGTLKPCVVSGCSLPSRVGIIGSRRGRSSCSGEFFCWQSIPNRTDQGGGHDDFG